MIFFACRSLRHRRRRDRRLPRSSRSPLPTVKDFGEATLVAAGGLLAVQAYRRTRGNGMISGCANMGRMWAGCVALLPVTRRRLSI